ncbi:MAG: MoxR family ATPase [Candidatus Palauibacterales bacterium]|nr:MoxR family ATPase [Candidatus Palauibacterales bacterium]MDP2529687.1 MoxR family ATPase [Candidatus Palauibacterales bacterium]MDP2584103.1 MoxR family ATPase [Candidatus Palauibacterales bacterium]
MERAIRAIVEAMEAQGYVADRDIATAVHLARRLRKPLLVEGEAGVGKTEIAKVVAAAFDMELIRLQCYEGLDVATALYEWNYPRQILRIRMGEAEGASARELEETIFDREYLLERPLLQAISREKAPVLLIDEIDRADEEFEAFLLELLSDFQVTIPELGTVRARSHPYVVLTSNGTRELSDALRRRCLYLWVDYPSFEKELRILHARVPDLRTGLDEEVARFVQRLRQEKLYKRPGVAETLDWARALEDLGVRDLEPEIVRATLGCLLKDRHDMEGLEPAELERLLASALRAPSEAPAGEEA